ncbi:endolytic transglycosylase MltG [Eleftheria terrae]|uniref:endolytic transglycosylase MltG n=1 Tax=Eleftheria terrae TaxID=1597781 RepID=UPI00263BBF7A|nr:endolytic transglycosylase MltG [Eleftheria terrae]WKB53302.1 endolytic transglycosylase MltG [Eleftheria terrae]
MRLLKRLFGVLLLLTALAAAVVAWWLHRPLPLASPSVEFSVESGMSPRQIANGWVAAGVEAPALALYEWFRWSGQARRIRAGSYEIGPGVTPRELLRKMVLGDETLATVRLIEGWTFKQFRAELARAEGLRPTTAAMSDAEIMAALGAPGRHPEGRFFPDTYAYSRGSSDMAVMKRAMRAMERKLAESWAARAESSPLKSPDDALVLASIVEKETGLSSDRAMVSGVFNNRLRIGMPLQTDPTVIYGLGDRYDGNLRKRDLQADTAYNTYTRPGLPPTPIAMPGKASLLAAVQPAATKALYFVSRGDGSSVFSESLNEHNRAVDKYQRKR